MRARISGAYSAAGLSRETTCELEGRVDGIRALAAELGDGADDDVLAQAFTRLGDGLLTRIGGTFALLVWSDATREGLRKYQQAEGLKVTGTLNKITLEKMNIALTDKQKTM